MAYFGLYAKSSLLRSSRRSIWSRAVRKVGSIPQLSSELTKVPFGVRNCSLQCTRGFSRAVPDPCVFMYTKRVPVLNAS